MNKLAYLNSSYYIDDDLSNFLKPCNPSRTPIFYMLPKIHKPNNPGRPFISGYDSPTAKLFVFLDYYLKHIVRTLPSDIYRDTDDVLQTVYTLTFSYLQTLSWSLWMYNLLLTYHKMREFKLVCLSKQLLWHKPSTAPQISGTNVHLHSQIQ